MKEILKLWYAQPATRHEETLPIGNGSLGAMIFGGTDEELLSLNEDTLWSGYPRDKNRPEAQPYLHEVRKLIQAEQLLEAEKLIQKHMLAEYGESYLPLGRLILRYTYTNSGSISKYHRELLLNDAVASVSYLVDSVAYRREYFASYPDRAIVIRLTCAKPEMTVAVSFDSLLSHGVKACAQGCELVIQGNCPEHVDPVYRDHPQIIQGTRGIAFSACCRLLSTDGIVSTAENEIFVKDATEIFLAFHMGAEDRSSLRQDYAVLKERHLADYQPLFNAVELYLGDQREEPTDVRLERLKESDDDPGLYALYFQYGRYLLISSSRRGSQPANLQGIWSWELLPPWSCNWTTNINLQMNYWHACSCNLLECIEPYFSLLKRLCENGKATAMKHYDCRGSVLHHNTDYWGTTSPMGIFYGEEAGRDGCVTWSFWVMGQAWLCRELYQYYEYTLDRAFLQDTAYPILRENALFLNDWLTEHNGVYESLPSTSPENKFILPDGTRCCISKNCAFDLEVIQEVFRNFRQVCAILALEDELLPELEDKLARLAPLQIGSKGQLLEWDKEYVEREPGHRHMSHLYGLYPSELFVNAPALQEACRKSLEMRVSNGGGYTGWSCAWLINLFSVLEDRENAYKFLHTLLTKSTYPNLWDAHPPFQIDGNFGGAAGIANMLVQDRGGSIKVLPALPDNWRNGYVKGLRIKGNKTIDIAWENGKAVQVDMY